MDLSDVHHFYAVVYLIDYKRAQVYYLKKHKPDKYWIHNKLVGWGGRIEGEESAEECIVRELKEELNFDIDLEKLKKRGEFHDGIKGYVHVFTYPLDERLTEGYVEGEGDAVYRDFDHCKRHPEEFADANRYFDSLVFETNAYFKIDFRDEE